MGNQDNFVSICWEETILADFLSVIIEEIYIGNDQSFYRYCIKNTDNHCHNHIIFLSGEFKNFNKAKKEAIVKIQNMINSLKEDFESWINKNQ